MIEKTREKVNLYINENKNIFKSFEVFVKDGKKLVFWKGGEFIQDKKNKVYSMTQNNKKITSYKIKKEEEKK